MAELNISAALLRLAKLFDKNGATLYCVGGMVRNSLLGLPVKDIDICSTLPIDAVESILSSAFIECRQKGASFGTLDIKTDGQSFEYACFRTEKYDSTGSHRPTEVSFGANIEQDAFRRDFTVNAIYFDILANKLIDPTGGIDDIGKKVLRSTSEDPNTIMRDDGVRIMRLARFAAQLGFTADEATVCAAYNNRAGLKDIAAERIFLELCKLVMADTCYNMGRESLLYGLHLLDSCGVIEVILPELKLCDGLKQRRDYHKYEVMEHCLQACACSYPKLEIRLAMLLHDTGKASAFYHHNSMHGHEMYSASIAESFLTRMKAPAALKNHIVQLVRYHMYDLKGEARPRSIKKRFVTWGKAFAEELILVREADVHGSGIELGKVDTAERWKSILSDMEADNAPFTEKQLNCTGEDICRWLDIKPCRRVGEVKRKLLLHCACKPQDNNSCTLEKIARDIGRGSTKDDKR